MEEILDFFLSQVSAEEIKKEISFHVCKTCKTDGHLSHSL